jgi:uncharacterized membrane protein YhhN
MKNIKAWGQLAVAILAAIYAALTDGTITTQEWIVVAGTGVGAFGVWLVPNLEGGVGHYAKGFVSFMTAGLPVLYVVIPGGLTQAETIEVVLAGLAAIGFVVGKGEKGYSFARQTTVRQAAEGQAPPL